jgi:peptide/nickel transport system substrate-binding protein
MTRLQDRLGRAHQLAQAGKLSRREFMNLYLAAGVSAMTAEASFVSAVRAAPKRGGSFRVGLGFGSSSDSLDPSTWQSGPGFLLGSSFGACLTEIDPKNGVQPTWRKASRAMTAG